MTKQLIHIEDILNERGFYISTTVGTSMYPMLRNRRDTVVIRPVTGKLKKYDIPLYRRGDDYVLHRIIGNSEQGYVICGDNCLHREYGITDNEIIGVLSEVIRGSKQVNMNGVGYKCYCRIWVACYPVRYIVKLIYMLLKRVKLWILG